MNTEKPSERSCEAARTAHHFTAGPIILIIMGALVLNIVVIAVVVGFIKKHFEGDYEEVKHG